MSCRENDNSDFAIVHMLTKHCFMAKHSVIKKAVFGLFVSLQKFEIAVN